MAKTIPQLTDATTVNAADELVIQQGGITKRATVEELMAGSVSVKHYGAVGDGVADDTAAIQAAINNHNSIAFTSGTYNITSNITVGSNRVLIFGPNAVITATSTYTLSFNNNAEIIAGRYKIFDGGATASNISIVFPEWWGATNADSAGVVSPTANTAFAAALDAARGNQGVISLDRTTYAWDGSAPLINSKGVSIIGQGIGKTGFKIVTAEHSLFSVTNCRFVQIEGFTVTTSAGIAPSSGTILNITCTDASLPAGNIIVRDVYINNCWRGIAVSGSSHSVRVNTTELFNVTLYGCFDYALLCTWIENIYAKGLFVNAADLVGGASGLVLLRDGCSGGDFVDCNFSNGQGYSLSCLSSFGNLREYNVMWFRFTNCNFDDASAGAYITDCHDIAFVNCRFWSNGRTSRSKNEGPGAHVNNSTSVKFLGCSFNNNGGNGLQIFPGAEHVTVISCELLGNNVNNYVLNYASLWSGKVATAGLYAENTNNIIVANNYSGNGIGGWNGQQKYGYYFAGTVEDSIITHNSSFSCDTEGFREPTTSTDVSFAGNFDNNSPLVFFAKPTGQAAFVPRAAAPSSPASGDVYYDSGTNKLRCYNGAAWQDLF